METVAEALPDASLIEDYALTTQVSELATSRGPTAATSAVGWRWAPQTVIGHDDARRTGPSAAGGEQHQRADCGKTSVFDDVAGDRQRASSWLRRCGVAYTAACR
ncbi:hypothetical protein DMH04_10425 [Kibdelosporangium aridum]|uniref:Uncharacterized protein n=1 Tax=Kibdelosporangium aridum TaxID=2030 RepID=A0A428ZH84_KIBAR|nr:hypothetical protein DMH04_10425 [Kibdelosporangium aridum]